MNGFRYFVILITLVTLPIDIGCQDSIIVDSQTDCIEYVKQLQPIISWDSTNQRLIKLAAVEFLLDQNCSYVGSGILTFVKYFGNPDEYFEYQYPVRTEDRVYSYRFKLYTETYGDKYTFGDKWLHINTTEDGRITMFILYVVDE